VRVGILAIQGDVEAHAGAIERAGAIAVPILREKQLDGVNALVLPGGESTTIAKGLDRLGLYGPLQAFGDSGRPILGTCAGAILLARASRNHPVRTLGLIDLVAERNGYGSQVDSFAAPGEISDDPGPGPGPGPGQTRSDLDGIRCVFIRAPILTDLGQGVEVLLRVDGAPVLVRQGNILACSFHPELGGDSRVHRMLLSG
jgi:5'-phosphate synthase pdxT subunit